MNWNRLGAAAVDALLVAFFVGAVVAPSDPVTQTVVVPLAFLVVLLPGVLFGAWFAYFGGPERFGCEPGSA